MVVYWLAYDYCGARATLTDWCFACGMSWHVKELNSWLAEELGMFYVGKTMEGVINVNGIVEC
jgi:hypothetical protein